MGAMSPWAGPAHGHPRSGPHGADLKNMSVEEMLATLIESKVINDYRDRHIHELVGDFNYLGTVQQHTESQQNEWTPPDPSMAQLRASITEYCVLPLGSAALSFYETLCDEGFADKDFSVAFKYLNDGRR